MMARYAREKQIPLDDACAAFDKLMKIFVEGAKERNTEKQKAVLLKLTQYILSLEPYADTERKKIFCKEAKNNIARFSKAIN